LIIAKYSSDPERKRIEYVFDKWREKLRIAKPEGIIAVVGSEEIEELVEELYSKTSRINISLYRVEEQALDIAKGESDISLHLNEKKEAVDKIVGFVMAKQKAVLKRETKDPFMEKVYDVITKKGKAEVSVSLRSEGQGASLRIKITGYGDVVEFLRGRLGEELRYLEG